MGVARHFEAGSSTSSSIACKCKAVSSWPKGRRRRYQRRRCLHSIPFSSRKWIHVEGPTWETAAKGCREQEAKPTQAVISLWNCRRIIVLAAFSFSISFFLFRQHFRQFSTVFTLQPKEMWCGVKLKCTASLGVTIFVTSILHCFPGKRCTFNSRQIVSRHFSCKLQWKP